MKIVSEVRWLIATLMAIVVILFIFFEKLRIVLIIAFIALLAAFGLEFTETIGI